MELVIRSVKSFKKSQEKKTNCDICKIRDARNVPYTSYMVLK